MTHGNGSTRDNLPEPIKLSPEEQIALLICLSQFNGDWEIYLTWLHGLTDDDERKEDLPLTAELAERDRMESIRENWLVESIRSQLLEMDVDNLRRVWEYCELVHKAAKSDNADED